MNDVNPSNQPQHSSTATEHLSLTGMAQAAAGLSFPWPLSSLKKRMGRPLLSINARVMMAPAEG
jgi:hypothetical protein